VHRDAKATQCRESHTRPQSNVCRELQAEWTASPNDTIDLELFSGKKEKAKRQFLKHAPKTADGNHCSRESAVNKDQGFIGRVQWKMIRVQ
jgi:hypothetical protein